MSLAEKPVVSTAVSLVGDAAGCSFCGQVASFVTGIFGGSGGGPKPPELIVRWDSGNGHLRNPRPGIYIGDNNLPGSESNAPTLRALEETLADPSRYDQTAVQQIIGSGDWSVKGNPGDSADSLIAQVIARFSPAQVSAATAPASGSGLFGSYSTPGDYSPQAAPQKKASIPVWIWIGLAAIVALVIWKKFRK